MIVQLLVVVGVVVACFLVAMAALFWLVGVLMDWAEKPKGFDVHCREAIDAAAPDEDDVHLERYLRHRARFLDSDPDRWFERHQAMRRESAQLNAKHKAEWKRLVNEDFEGINQ